MKSELLRLVLVVAVLAGTACARTLPGEEPPPASFYFPNGIGISPDGRFAYVANANFDLRYSAGWLSVVDLDRALQGEPIDRAVLSQLKVLSLAGGVSLSPKGALAVLGHRGVATVTLVEVTSDGATLACGDSEAEESLSNDEKYTDCDRAHLLQTLCLSPQLDEEMRPAGCPEEDSGDRHVFAERLTELQLSDPFATTLFSRAGSEETFLAVSHLTPGDTDEGEANALLLFRVESGADFGQPVVLAPAKAVALGNAGVAALAARSDSRGTFLAAATQQYSTSSEYSTVYAIDVDRTLAEGADRYAGHSVSGEVGGASLASLTFSAPDGNLAYASNRSPSSVVVLDASLENAEERDSDGAIKIVTRPRFHVLDAVPLPHRPASVLHVVRQEGEDLLAVASFSDDVVYLLSTEGTRLRITARLDVPGHGPLALGHVTRGDRDFLLITTFFSHALLIYEITGADATAFPLLAVLKSDETPAAQPAR